MNATEILEYLRDRDIQVKLVDNEFIDLSPAKKLTDELIERLRQHKPAIIAELKREQRYQKVLQMLTNYPDKQRVYITDDRTDPDNVILTVAIRNLVSYEMLIPKSKYDLFVLFELISTASSN
ncbi:MAG: hypothetical protein H6937_08895 [Burkholderiales bacterium]|nr:hypothetical protein [Burkholderiales bacterium]